MSSRGVFYVQQGLQNRRVVMRGSSQALVVQRHYGTGHEASQSAQGLPSNGVNTEFRSETIQATKNSVGVLMGEYIGSPKMGICCRQKMKRVQAPNVKLQSSKERCPPVNRHFLHWQQNETPLQQCSERFWNMSIQVSIPPDVAGIIAEQSQANTEAKSRFIGCPFSF